MVFFGVKMKVNRDCGSPPRSWSLGKVPVAYVNITYLGICNHVAGSLTVYVDRVPRTCPSDSQSGF